MNPHAKILGLATITLAFGLALFPPGVRAQDERKGDGPRRDKHGEVQKYSIEQALSDQAQLHTIAFNGLAFITGDFGADTFIPPGKVCDFFGFQYMRDIDAAGKGHNPVFLNRVSANILRLLDENQRKILADLAREQAPQFNELALKRLPVIKAFCRELQGDLPAGSKGLNKEAVMKHLGDMFLFDARMSLDRARAYGRIVRSFTPEQKSTLAAMKFGDFNTWPGVDVEPYKMPRGTEKMVNVAYMTYASELFSWLAGSVEADTYFCPERHGTYFGGFYMKDMPAMGKKDYDISTSVTGDSGKDFLGLLTPDQRALLTALPGLQKQALASTVTVRRDISVELRRILGGAEPDQEKILTLGRRYGELDGEMSWLHATAFARVARTLSPEQRAAMMRLRNLDGYTSAPAYLYSAPLDKLPALSGTDDFFFAPGEARGTGL